MINVPVKPGFNWQDHKTVVEAVNASIARLGNQGRVLLRPSGTEPVLRVMVEAIDADLSRNEAAAIAAVVQAAL
jgi:phosphoglucosamine mutase